jgi:uncharacterized protein YprB with RNaseH-like and TPR domain
MPHSKGGNIDRFARLAALRPARGVASKPAELRAPDETDSLSRLLGAGIARNHFGEHLAIRNWFSTPEFAEPSPVALELLTKPTALRKAGQKAGHYKGKSPSPLAQTALEDPAKWLFLDTETTGLAGGTGTYAFLVGLAWWDSGGLQVEQLFLRDFSEEHSLLHELASRIAERPVLVTFNGKTFDWPLLENRFTMTRTIKVPRLAAHLDLLHPARALWKLRLGSVRLVDLERKVLDAQRLGLHRYGDVASALIPQYYFDYLRGGAPDPLAGVVKHNQMDLRGLAALFVKINSLLDERGALDGADSLDLFGLSRFLERRGERERAQATCVKALDAGLPAEFRKRARREMALMAKRSGEAEKAEALWQELARDPKEGSEACEQLAIYYERQAKDLQRALEFAQLGLMKLERLAWASRDPIWHARKALRQEKLMCRVKRLRHRIETSDAATQAPLLANPAAAGGGVR